MTYQNNIEKAKSIPIATILDSFGVYKQGKNYRCIFHDDNNPSAYIMKDGCHLFCTSCQESFSTIDVYMKLTGVYDVMQAVDELNNGYAFTGFNTANATQSTPVESENEKNTEVQFRLEMINRNNKDKLIEYLRSRNIARDNESAERLFKKLDKHNIVYGADDMGQATFIFNDNFLIYRSQKYNENRVNKNAKMDVVEFSGGFAKTVYVVEGIYDALTLLDNPFVDVNVICLNSLNMKKKFFKKIDDELDKYKEYEFVIALDNDRAVKMDENKELEVEKVIKQMEDFFKKRKLNYSKFHRLYNSNFKDINEMRMNNIL